MMNNYKPSIHKTPTQAMLDGYISQTVHEMHLYSRIPTDFDLTHHMIDSNWVINNRNNRKSSRNAYLIALNAEIRRAVQS